MLHVNALSARSLPVLNCTSWAFFRELSTLSANGHYATTTTYLLRTHTRDTESTSEGWSAANDDGYGQMKQTNKQKGVFAARQYHDFFSSCKKVILNLL